MFSHQQVQVLDTVLLTARCTMQVDVLDPEAKGYPGFEAVPYLQCWLRQGQMLFIPRKWWHFVQAASSSLSISYWWTDEQS